jgi:hypothetical protein
MNASRFPGLSPALILLADNIIHSDDCSYESPDLEVGDPGVDCDCYVEQFYGFLASELTRLERLSNHGDPETIQAIVSALPDYPRGRTVVEYATHVSKAFIEAMLGLRTIATQCEPGPARRIARSAWVTSEALVSHRILNESDIDFSPLLKPVEWKDEAGEVEQDEVFGEDMCDHRCGRVATRYRRDGRPLCKPCYDAEDGVTNDPDACLVCDARDD